MRLAAAGWPPFVLVLIISLLCFVHGGDYTLGMDSETSCTKTHYYKAGDVFTASANGMVHGGNLGMDSETSCTKTHYYKAGDVFTASANGMVHGGNLGMDSETSCTKTHYYKAGDVFTASANGMVHGGNLSMDSEASCTKTHYYKVGDVFVASANGMVHGGNLGLDSETSCTKTHYYKAGDVFTASANGMVHGGNLGMDSETSCTKTHYYKAGDVFTASANGMVHGGNCPLTFIQSGMRGYDTVEPCLSLCVKIVSYTMDSCNVEMAYHDGIDDYTPVTFDCHTFPPVMWCSSKNDLKVVVSEAKNYRGKDYAITLEVKPFCGKLDNVNEENDDEGVVAVPYEEPKAVNRTFLIVGGVVGTVSILFVMGWTLYCYKKRQNEDDMADQYQQDRRYRSTTPNQQTNRYAPVGFHVPASSHSSSDHGVMDPYYAQKDSMHQAGGAGDIKRPYHDIVQPQLSNHSHMTGSEPWFPMAPMNQGVPEKGQTPMPQQPPGNQQSQYLLQNKVYNYPQFNNTENPPSDTRYVVYDFDFPAPTQRKYSGSKMGMGRDSPVRDMDRLRSRELTPNRDRSRPMPPIESTTTDHTSDNDDSSYSVTTEDETTTDDQMSPVKGHMYNIVPPFGYGAMINRDPNARFYNPANFQPVQVNMNNPVSSEERQNLRTRSTPSDQVRFRNNVQPSVSDKDLKYSGPNPNSASPSRPMNTAAIEEREGPQPQVPSPQVPTLPRQVDKSMPVNTSPNKDLPWPHNPPPAYSQIDSGDSEGEQII